MTARFLLWDHDGVIVDTERWYFEATREVLSRLQVELTQRRYLELMAAGRASWDLARERGVPEAEIRALRCDRDELYRRFLQTQPIEIEGVGEVLAQLAPRHHMAIITTARRRDVELIHKDRDLLRFFDFVLTIEDYDRPKPHPVRTWWRFPGSARSPQRRSPSRIRRAGWCRRARPASIV
jgi:beta-phosphoglucomutase-like phosphatase (HAD superfamily)